MGRVSSVAWKYFQKTEDGGVCKIKGCGRRIKRSGTSTSNFFQHIQRAHKAVANELALAVKGPRADPHGSPLSDLMVKTGQTFHSEAGTADVHTTNGYPEQITVPFPVIPLLNVKTEPELELSLFTTQTKLVPLAPVNRGQPRQSLLNDVQQQAEPIQSEPMPTFLNILSQLGHISRSTFATSISACNETQQSVSDDSPLHVQPAELLWAPNYLDTLNQFDRVFQVTPGSTSVHRYKDCRDVLMERVYRECVAFSEAEDDSSRQQALTWLEEDFKILKAFQNAM